MRRTVRRRECISDQSSQIEPQKMYSECFCTRKGLSYVTSVLNWSTLCNGSSSCAQNTASHHWRNDAFKISRFRVQWRQLSDYRQQAGDEINLNSVRLSVDWSVAWWALLSSIPSSNQNILDGVMKRLSRDSRMSMVHPVVNWMTFFPRKTPTFSGIVVPGMLWYLIITH